MTTKSTETCKYPGSIAGNGAGTCGKPAKWIATVSAGSEYPVCGIHKRSIAAWHANATLRPIDQQ